MSSSLYDAEGVFLCSSKCFRGWTKLNTLRFKYQWTIERFLSSLPNREPGYRQPFQLEQQHLLEELRDLREHNHEIGGQYNQQPAEQNLDNEVDLPTRSTTSRLFVDSPLFAADVSRGLNWFVRLTAPTNPNGQHYGLQLHLDRSSSWSDARATLNACVSSEDGTEQHWLWEHNELEPGLYTVDGSSRPVGSDTFLPESSVADVVVDGKLIINIEVTVFPLKVKPTCDNLPDGSDGASQLLRRFAGLLERRVLVDVTLVTDDGYSFPAHRCLLASRSKFFKAMFTGEWVERSQPTVTVSGIESDVFEDVMTFMYNDAIPSKLSVKPVDVLAAADRFGLERLATMAENQLVEQLTVDNVCDTLLLADQFSRPYLKTTSMKFLIENGHAVSQTEHWMELREHLVLEEVLLAASRHFDVVRPRLI